MRRQARASSVKSSFEARRDGVSTSRASAQMNSLSCPNVLLITPWYGGSGNGVAAVVESIAQTIPRLGAKCVVLQIVGDGWLPKAKRGGFGELVVSLCIRLRPKNGNLFRLAAAMLREAVAHVAVRYLVKRHHLQVAHFHYYMPSYTFVHRACKSVGLPRMATFHGSDLTVNMQDVKARETTAVNLSECYPVTAVSDSLKATLLGLFPEVGPKARTVHNSVPASFLEQVEKTARAVRDIDVLFVGNLVERKGADVLVRAVKLVNDQIAGLRVVIAGGGAQLEALTALAKQLGVASVMEFLGRQDRIDLVPLYVRARILAVPSRTEPFGLVVVEGQICGAAVVASDVGGIPEIIADGATGKLVAPDDPDALAAAILNLLGDEAGRTRIASAASKSAAEGFSPLTVCSAYSDAYRDALASAAIR